MKEFKQFLLDLSYSEIKNIFAKHLLWSKGNGRVSGTPKWFDEPDTLNVIGFDCDSNSFAADNEIEFNLGRYKDFLMLIYNNPSGSYDQVIIEVTLDPETDKYGRMNLMPGVYDAYRVGIHGLSTGLTTVYVPEKNETYMRYALRQDRAKVYVARTDGSNKSKVIKYEWSMSYSNIHNPGKSAGCTVTKTNKDWFEKLLPYLVDIDTIRSKNVKIRPANHNKITYCVMNHKQLELYANEVIERPKLAKAVDPAIDYTDPGAVVAGKAVKEGGQ